MAAIPKASVESTYHGDIKKNPKYNPNNLSFSYDEQDLPD